MVVLTAVIKVVEGKGDEFVREFQKLAPQVRKDPGALAYVLHRNLKNPDQFFFYEKYENDEALKYHVATAHFKEFGRNIKNLMAAPSELNYYQQID